MSSDHLACLSTGSTLSPISLTPRLSNSGFSLARTPSSVVQTGVKSLGCENRTAQLLPIQSWKLIVPWVVSAVKFGASSLMRSDIVSLHSVWFARQRSCAAIAEIPRLAGPFLTLALILSIKHGVAGNSAQAGPDAYFAALR